MLLNQRKKIEIIRLLLDKIYLGEKKIETPPKINMLISMFDFFGELNEQKNGVCALNTLERYLN